MPILFYMHVPGKSLLNKFAHYELHVCMTTLHVADYCTHNEQCHSDAVCVNSECVCNGGFTGNGTHCTGMTRLVGETTYWLK